MDDLLRKLLFEQRPSWLLISLTLAVGIIFVTFGNVDRLFWKATSNGATLPGLVIDVRSYRHPDTSLATYVPKVAFRDHSGVVRIRETARSSIHYDFKQDQPVLVAWNAAEDTVAIDLPFRRERITSLVMWLFSATGLTAWIGGIWLLIQRIRLRAQPSL